MPPHVTLSYPFEDAKRLSDRTIAEIQNIVGGFSTFEFHLSRVCCFDNLPQTSYVWLAPSPFEPFLELTEALAAAFPQFPPFGGAFEQTIPHLTIAASRDKQALGRIEERLAPLLPITAHASSVEIMEHRLGSWRARATAVLSNSAEPNSWPG
jgi:2'-5' RNA ligase